MACGHVELKASKGNHGTAMHLWGADAHLVFGSALDASQHGRKTDLPKDEQAAHDFSMDAMGKDALKDGRCIISAWMPWERILKDGRYSTAYLSHAV